MGECRVGEELKKLLLQVGQCGNQIGCRFWDMALKEHAATSKDTIYDEPLSSFFRNVDARQSREEGGGLPVGSSISKLKARAVLVDTEDGVLKQLLSGSLGEIFDGRQIISDEVITCVCLSFMSKQTPMTDVGLDASHVPNRISKRGVLLYHSTIFFFDSRITWRLGSMGQGTIGRRDTWSTGACTAKNWLQNSRELSKCVTRCSHSSYCIPLVGALVPASGPSSCLFLLMSTRTCTGKLRTFISRGSLMLTHNTVHVLMSLPRLAMQI